MYHTPFDRGMMQFVDFCTGLFLGIKLMIMECLTSLLHGLLVVSLFIAKDNNRNFFS